MTTHLLRLRRTDARSEHLLLNVRQERQGALDAKLIGTEREHLYHGRVEGATASSLRASGFSGDAREWHAVLAFALFHQTPDDDDDGPLPEALQGVEAVAAISGPTATITVRRNVGGITQRLGSVRLERDDEREEVGFLDWVDEAVATADRLRARLNPLQAAVSRQQDQIARLTAELDALVRAKQEHEDALLVKFAALVNAKKLKIRDQQRLLARARIHDHDPPEPIRHGGSGSGSPRRPGSSRGGKRKANRVSASAVSPRDDDDDDDDGNTFAKSTGAQDGERHVDEEMDEDDDEDQDDRARQETPETDEADATDAELEEHATGDGGGGGGEAERADQAHARRRLATRHAPHAAEHMDVDAAAADDEETDDEL